MSARPLSRAERLAKHLFTNGEVTERVSTNEIWFLTTKLKVKDLTANLRASMSPTSAGTTHVQVSRDGHVIFEAQGTKDPKSMKPNIDAAPGTWEAEFGIV